MAVPLKQPNSKPSFRKLFPEPRTTKNLKNTKCRILQELQTSFKNKDMKNLSFHHLSPNKSDVLALGCNFVPKPPTSTQHFMQELATHLNQIRGNTSISKPVPNY